MALAVLPRKAIFSTELYSFAPRHPPGDSQPQIARSNPSRDAYYFAQGLRQRYPEQCENVLPELSVESFKLCVYGYFNAWDIDLHGPEFLWNVIYRLARDNGNRVVDFTTDWYEEHKIQVDSIRGPEEVETVQSQDVDLFFGQDVVSTHGELFLKHVLNHFAFVFKEQQKTAVIQKENSPKIVRSAAVIPYMDDLTVQKHRNPGDARTRDEDDVRKSQTSKGQFVPTTRVARRNSMAPYMEVLIKNNPRSMLRKTFSVGPERTYPESTPPLAACPHDDSQPHSDHMNVWPGSSRGCEAQTLEKPTVQGSATVPVTPVLAQFPQDILEQAYDVTNVMQPHRFQKALSHHQQETLDGPVLRFVPDPHLPSLDMSPTATIWMNQQMTERGSRLSSKGWSDLMNPPLRLYQGGETRNFLVHSHYMNNPTFSTNQVPIAYTSGQDNWGNKFESKSQSKAAGGSLRGYGGFGKDRGRDSSSSYGDLYDPDRSRRVCNEPATNRGGRGRGRSGYQSVNYDGRHGISSNHKENFQPRNTSRTIEQFPAFDPSFHGDAAMRADVKPAPGDGRRDIPPFDPLYDCSPYHIGERRTDVTTLHVSNFGPDISSDDLRRVFLRSVSTVTFTAQPLATAAGHLYTFATFENHVEARAALKLNGFRLGDQALRVQPVFISNRHVQGLYGSTPPQTPGLESGTYGSHAVSRQQLQNLPAHVANAPKPRTPRRNKKLSHSKAQSTPQKPGATTTRSNRREDGRSTESNATNLFYNKDDASPSLPLTSQAKFHAAEGETLSMDFLDAGHPVDVDATSEASSATVQAAKPSGEAISPETLQDEEIAIAEQRLDLSSPLSEQWSEVRSDGASTSAQPAWSDLPDATAQLPPEEQTSGPAKVTKKPGPKLTEPMFPLAKQLKKNNKKSKSQKGKAKLQDVANGAAQSSTGSTSTMKTPLEDTRQTATVFDTIAPESLVNEDPMETVKNDSKGSSASHIVTATPKSDHRKDSKIGPRPSLVQRAPSLGQYVGKIAASLQGILRPAPTDERIHRSMEDSPTTLMSESDSDHTVGRLEEAHTPSRNSTGSNMVFHDAKEMQDATSPQLVFETKTNSPVIMTPAGSPDENRVHQPGVTSAVIVAIPPRNKKKKNKKKRAASKAIKSPVPEDGSEGLNDEERGIVRCIKRLQEHVTDSRSGTGGAHLQIIQFNSEPTPKAREPSSTSSYDMYSRELDDEVNADNDDRVREMKSKMERLQLQERQAKTRAEARRLEELFASGQMLQERVALKDAVVQAQAVHDERGVSESINSANDETRRASTIQSIMDMGSNEQGNVHAEMILNPETLQGSTSEELFTPPYHMASPRRQAMHHFLSPEQINEVNDIYQTAEHRKYREGSNAAQYAGRNNWLARNNAEQTAEELDWYHDRETSQQHDFGSAARVQNREAGKPVSWAPAAAAPNEGESDVADTASVVEESEVKGVREEVMGLGIADVVGGTGKTGEKRKGG
ncbi:hypothetical protein B0A49_03947 [Cryomyces minteri]|uniref:RRM domain-containing protein n=1 Tax=Cryomyces minteri TaxID=331657 RepID=A0A4U0XF31_9PEZI|nr:hypothetical protein B0A49_03947 [Cryomyces minteri]